MTVLSADLDQLPVVRAARALAGELAADAERLERDGVTRATMSRMAEAGMLAVYGPPELGGTTGPAARRVSELLAGSSPDAWFVWYQHGPVVKMLSRSNNQPLQDRYLADLCAGRAQGGVAFSHLRTATPSVTAQRVDGGWRLTGWQPWSTGWGMTDLVLVGAVAGDQVVFGLLPADAAGMASDGELALSSMGGTSTHSLRFDGALLPDDARVLVTDFAEWAAGDLAMNTNVQPSTFGVALAALDLLEEWAPLVVDVLRPQVLSVRERAYRLIDEVAPGDGQEQRLALRAQALLLAMQSCTALLTARGGQGIGLADPAQRLLRAAAFQIVHSQAAHIRTATLAALSG